MSSTESMDVNVDNLKNLENLINADKLQLFHLNETAEWKGELEDKSLFRIWYELSHNRCIENEVNLI